MRIPALAILAVGVVLATAPARAQTYDPNFPVCMHITVWGGPHEDCSYYTMAQCAQSASGRAGQCNINPYYGGARDAFARSDRWHRRAY
jgi:hypothetical protein